MLYSRQQNEGRNQFDFDWDQDQSFSDLQNDNKDAEVGSKKVKLKNNNPFGIASKVIDFILVFITFSSEMG